MAKIVQPAMVYDDEGTPDVAKIEVLKADADGNLKIIIRFKCPNCSKASRLEFDSELT